MPSVTASARSLHRVRTQLGIGVPMRDGVKLSTDLYLPDAPGPFPVILIRTPYCNNVAAGVEDGVYFAQRGYVVAIQDVRGRFDSEGRVVALRSRGPGRLRRAGMVRDAAVVHRKGRHERGVLPRAHPVAGGAAPQPASRGHGAPRRVLEPLSQLGLHRRRLPARVQPPLGRGADAHADEPAPASLDAAGAALLDAVLAPAASHGRRARRARQRVLPGVDPAPGLRPVLGATRERGEGLRRDRRSRPTGSAAGTTCSCRAPSTTSWACGPRGRPSARGARRS